MKALIDQCTLLPGCLSAWVTPQRVIIPRAATVLYCKPVRYYLWHFYLQANDRTRHTMPTSPWGLMSPTPSERVSRGEPFSALRQIHSVRRALPQNALLVLVRSLVITELDRFKSAHLASNLSLHKYWPHINCICSEVYTHSVSLSFLLCIWQLLIANNIN